MRIILAVDLETNEDAHNDRLQKAARTLAWSLIDLITSRAHRPWGKPDLQLDWAAISKQKWIEDAVLIPADVLVGWQRPDHKVPFLAFSHEDRELPIMVCMGVALRPSRGRRASPKGRTKQ